MAANDSKQFEISVTLGDDSFTASGPANLVKEALAEFKAMVEPREADSSSAAPTSSGVGTTTTRKRPAKRRRGGTRKKAEKAEETREPVDASKMTLPHLLNETTFTTNAETAAAIVIWSADHEGKQSVTKEEVERFWGKTSVKVPKNLWRDLGTAVKKGWIDRKDDAFVPQGYGRSQLGIK